VGGLWGQVFQACNLLCGAESLLRHCWKLWYAGTACAKQYSMPDALHSWQQSSTAEKLDSITKTILTSCQASHTGSEEHMRGVSVLFEIKQTQTPQHSRHAWAEERGTNSHLAAQQQQHRISGASVPSQDGERSLLQKDHPAEPLPMSVSVQWLSHHTQAVAPALHGVTAMLNPRRHNGIHCHRAPVCHVACPKHFPPSTLPIGLSSACCLPNPLPTVIMQSHHFRWSVLSALAAASCSSLVAMPGP
jgi:hypothetical protein